MASQHSYYQHELPAAYEPFGTDWMVERLKAVGYTDPLAYQNQANPDLWVLQVAENHVSKNQLAFDVVPPHELTVDIGVLNIAPGNTAQVKVRGPTGAVVKTKFKGTGFIAEHTFSLQAPGERLIEFGPCPVGQFVVDPQVYHFSVDGTDVAPVAVMATFM